MSIKSVSPKTACDRGLFTWPKVACPILFIAALSAAPALAQSTGQNQSSQQNQTSATQQNTAPSENTKITNGRDFDNLQYELKNRNAFLDAAQTTAPIDSAALAAGFGIGVTVLSRDDPYWTGQKSTFNTAVLRKLRDAGFSTIRIPVVANLNAAGQLDADYLKRLDSLINSALKARLLIILVDSDDGTCATDTAICATRLPTVWNFLAQHFQDAPSSLSFELLNAPSGAVNAEIWNGWTPGLVSIIRESNPTRNILIDSADAGSAAALEKLKLPADPHILGAFQILQSEASNEDSTKSALAAAKAWSAKAQRPVILVNYTAPAGQADWIRQVSQAAEETGVSRVYAVLTGGVDENGIMTTDGRGWNESFKRSVLNK